ncbi:MAG TPA: hypothetical protein VK050_05525 [Flavobacteriaceae bacterium]|nr:hypothetical protein [Flavobacteriaceae bacterium]
MTPSDHHPSNNIDVKGGKLIPDKLYTYREGSLKATIRFIKDYSDDEYFRYHIRFIDGREKGKEILVEKINKPIGYWGMWYIRDYQPDK